LSRVKKTVRLFHFKQEESQPLIDVLEAGGFEVSYPGERTLGAMRDLRLLNPHAVVIDLSRMPAYGRYTAAGIRQTKSLRHLPIVFVDGDPKKVDLIRETLPDALYTSRARVVAALKKVKPPADPVAPPKMMDSYQQRPTALKLGMKEGLRVAVFDPPPGYAKLLGAVPEGVELMEEPTEVLPLTLWFVSDPDSYHFGLRRMRRWAEKSRVWVIYPKGSKSRLTQFTIREGALAMGMVDYKVCSVDATWTGILFTIKK
jgi:hypothetical protein